MNTRNVHIQYVSKQKDRRETSSKPENQGNNTTFFQKLSYKAESSFNDKIIQKNIRKVIIQHVQHVQQNNEITTQNFLRSVEI